jgi:hypothetical protein
MAKVFGEVSCQDGEWKVIRTYKAPIPVATGNRSAPVQVKLRRLSANHAQAYPPDGETEVWWGRLKNALGTSSDALVDASLRQLQSAAQLPNGGISETALNAALAIVEAAAPKNEIEAALAIQMAATHAASMSVLSRYATQVETLRRLRHGGSQLVRVEHVHINEGGKALIGNVNPKDETVSWLNVARLRDSEEVQNATMKWLVTDLRALARHVWCAPRCYVRRIVNAGRRWRGKG